MKTSLFSALGLALVASAPAHAEAGDVIARLRGIIVSPTETSSGVQPTFPTGRVAVDDAIVPEVDFTYMLSDRIGAELILATSPHDIEGRGALGDLGELADTMALPPTLTLQYHFAPDAGLRPYVGAGVNYTIFYNEDAGRALEAALGSTRVKLSDSVGYAVQAGVDIDLSDRWLLNLDVKYIDIDTEAKLTTGTLVNTVKVSIDPVVFGVGIGTRF
jgi:outer membrane protein